MVITNKVVFPIRPPGADGQVGEGDGKGGLCGGLGASMHCVVLTIGYKALCTTCWTAIRVATISMPVVERKVVLISCYK